MDELLLIVQTINSYLSNYVLIVLLIGAGLFFTIRTRFVQVRCFGEGIKRLFGGFNLNGEKHKSGMSSFQAVATAIAAQVVLATLLALAAQFSLAGQRYLLDVAHRIPGYGNQLRRSSIGSEDAQG